MEKYLRAIESNNYDPIVSFDIATTKPILGDVPKLMHGG
jgi:hypothetical protein